MAIQSINPATGKTLRRYQPLPSSAIEAALGRAASAFTRWRTLPLEERGACLLKAAQILRERKQVLGKLITLEMGKPVFQSVAEVEKCAWACEYFAENTRTLLADEPVATQAYKSYVRFAPLGVVCAIMPWNFPLWQVFRAAAPALMAGNVVVLKHAANVPQCALAIEAVFRRAGVPKGVFQTLLVGSAAMGRILADARIAAVTLTGSEAAGIDVARVAAEHLKKVVLELGGSDPFVVLKDVDLNRCCRLAAQARTINSGQSCIAAKRFVVDAAVAERFTACFVEQMQALRVGDPLDSATEVGPLARADLRAELHRQVQKSVRRGARLLTGGRMLAGPGFFYAPTVLANVAPGMPAYEEEIFGPVASVIVARGEDEAVRIANDTCFGLGASVWSQDIERAEAIARRIEAGTVFVNDFVKSDPRLPFGGVKRSGYGRELGTYGIKEFTNIQTIVVG